MAQPSNVTQRPSRERRPNGNFMFWVLLGVVFIMIMMQQESKYALKTKTYSYSDFYSILKENHDNPQIKKLELTEGPENAVKGVLTDGTEFKLNVPARDEDLIKLMRENVKDFSVVPPELFWSQQIGRAHV